MLNALSKTMPASNHQNVSRVCSPSPSAPDRCNQRQPENKRREGGAELSELFFDGCFVGLSIASSGTYRKNALREIKTHAVFAFFDFFDQRVREGLRRIVLHDARPVQQRAFAAFFV